MSARNALHRLSAAFARVARKEGALFLGKLVAVDCVSCAASYSAGKLAEQKGLDPRANILISLGIGLITTKGVAKLVFKDGKVILHTPTGGLDSTAYHMVDDAKKAQSVLDGIDISYTSPESRFGQGFYVSADGDTTVAELAYHGAKAKYSICYDMNLKGQKILDLTNPSVALDWGYIQSKSSIIDCQSIADRALDEGYNVIKVQSYRGKGINYIIYDDFDEILSPQMVTPVEKWEEITWIEKKSAYSLPLYMQNVPNVDMNEFYIVYQNLHMERELFPQEMANYAHMLT